MGPVEKPIAFPLNPLAQEQSQLYQRREAPKPTLAQRIGRGVKVVSPKGTPSRAAFELLGKGASAVGKSLLNDARIILEGVGKVTAPVTDKLNEFDRLNGVPEGTTLDALIFFNPGLKMVGGLESAAMAAQARIAGRALVNAPKAYVGKAIETGGVPAGIRTGEAVTAARAAKVAKPIVAEALPTTLPELYRTIEKNEGSMAVDFVRALHRNGIDTMETHATPRTFSIRVTGLSDANKIALRKVPDVKIIEYPELRIGNGLPYVTVEVTNTPAGARNAAAVLQREGSPITQPFAWDEGLSPLSQVDQEMAYRAALPTEDKLALEQSMGGIPPIKPPVTTTPSQATIQVKTIQQKGLTAPENVLPEEARVAHVEMGAPDGPRPPKPPLVARGVPDEPADIVAQIAAKATKKERPDQTLLRLHEGAVSTEARRNGIIVRDGNAKLKALNIGVTRRGQLIPRTEDVSKLDELYNALHNPSKVASGEIQVPKGFEDVYTELRGLTDWEQAARLDFDPAMATVDDYFYRGWKPPEGAFVGVEQGRPLVKTPAFKKPRVDATYQEMREAGFEPLFWNPYQQWGLSRMQGTKYREQMKLVEYLKGMGDEFARPHLGGPIPKGWRVPEVGPAFEGKPFATLDATGEPTTMFTRRWIVPDKIANTLENIYGKKPNLGKFIVAGKTIDPLAIIDFLTFVPKRAKLMFSFFQQADFLERAGAGSWTRMVDALQTGHPIKAVTALAKYPKSVVDIIRSNFSPGFRQSLARQLDSTEALVVGRPGVHMRGIGEAGLSTIDPAMFKWEEMDKVVREVAKETGILGKGHDMVRAVGDLESAMRRGLFEGVYPTAMMTDIKNNVAPMVARMHPAMNDAQLNGTIARLINIKYSSIPASQSVIQNRVLRETLRRVFFSMGESEGLLRQAAGVVSGPNKAFWAKHWLGTYLFVIATASVIHFASTGKHLPWERFTPISKDKWGPLPFGYNTRFASPTIPIKGRGGAELTLDVVGQMDTALRVLNPSQFLSSRESVPIRAIVNQVSGTDFFGNRIDDVGPGGVVSRTAQLIQDMFSPIGAGGIGSELVRRNIPGAEQVVQEGETRLGLTGLGIQATGLNIRAATREQRLFSTIPQAKTIISDLGKLGLDLGYVTRNFDTKLGVKGGEITLTSEQREQLQWLTDDTVVTGLLEYLPNVLKNTRTDEAEKKELIKSRMATLRATAREKFRRSLLIGAKSPNQSESVPMVPYVPKPTPTYDWDAHEKRFQELQKQSALGVP